MKCTWQRCQVAPRTLTTAAFSPLVRVRDHQLRAAQAATCQAAQELDPERLGLAVADGHAKHLAPSVGVDTDGDDDRDRDDMVVAPCFNVSGIQPDIGPLALDRALRKVFARSSISPHNRSTERVEMPWTWASWTTAVRNVAFRSPVVSVKCGA